MIKALVLAVDAQRALPHFFENTTVAIAALYFARIAVDSVVPFEVSKKHGEAPKFVFVRIVQ